ncbi:MAG: hypothetical protein HZB46_09290, partial [Solirubrobacterales bacterium]|nr:hypothetical protein [Solirubrobacterales bacterium]
MFGDGRVFERRMVPGLADVAPGGRVRLDGLARWMQDVAYADVLDAGVGDAAVWVVRRMALTVGRWPRFGEEIVVRTACTGLGRAWAERTTTVSGGDGGEVRAVGLWVHLDPETQRPSPLTAAELEVYGSSAGDRQVKARLRHPAPPEGARNAGSWRFRATDLDLLDHVNNAAYWQVLEEALLAGA